MSTLEKFDRDLKWNRRAVIAVGAMNLSGALCSFWVGNLTLGIAYCMWVAACRVWLNNIRCNQTTRDRARIADAMIRGES